MNKFPRLDNEGHLQSLRDFGLRKPRKIPGPLKIVPATLVVMALGAVSTNPRHVLFTESCCVRID